MDSGFRACERVNSEQQHSQAEGGMTYQLGIAMPARKRKRKIPAALGGRDVLYERRVQTEHVPRFDRLPTGVAWALFSRALPLF